MFNKVGHCHCPLLTRKNWLTNDCNDHEVRSMFITVCHIHIVYHRHPLFTHINAIVTFSSPCVHLNRPLKSGGEDDDGGGGGGGGRV